MIDNCIHLKPGAFSNSLALRMHPSPQNKHLLVVLVEGSRHDPCHDPSPGHDIDLLDLSILLLQLQNGLQKSIEVLIALLPLAKGLEAV